jgi:beta-lactamase class A
MLQDLFWQKLAMAVDRAIDTFDGVMGVALLDLTDGRTLLRHADAVFPTASAIKMGVLAELYHQQEQTDQGATGLATLGDLYTVDPADLVEGSHILGGLTPGVTRLTNRDLATCMIAVSDNAATNILIDRVGMERVNALLANLGLTETRLRRKMIDLEAAQAGRENSATPHELVRFLEAVSQERVLSHPLTQDFLTVLSTGKQSYIPRRLPPDVRVANKPGALDGLRADAGIVYAPGRPFAIAIMTTYVHDDNAAEEAIAALALSTYQHFERLGSGSAYGRRLPAM